MNIFTLNESRGKYNKCPFVLTSIVYVNESLDQPCSCLCFSLYNPMLYRYF